MVINKAFVVGNKSTIICNTGKYKAKIHVKKDADVVITNARRLTTQNFYFADLANYQLISTSKGDLKPYQLRILVLLLTRPLTQ